ENEPTPGRIESPNTPKTHAAALGSLNEHRLGSRGSSQVPDPRGLPSPLRSGKGELRSLGIEGEEIRNHLCALEGAEGAGGTLGRGPDPDLSGFVDHRQTFAIGAESHVDQTRRFGRML